MVWRVWQPLRLSILGLHCDSFTPSYTVCDPIIIGLGFWPVDLGSLGLEAFDRGVLRSDSFIARSVAIVGIPTASILGVSWDALSIVTFGFDVLFDY
jgi:hypothetical protein